ncbi:hypothetical protein Plhal710r2_c013g0060811 [Plasmopara halstedii]
MEVVAAQPIENSHQLVVEHKIPVSEEMKSDEHTPPDSLLTEAFATYSPDKNRVQLTEWKNQGKLAEDLVEKLLNNPHEEAIRDGSLLKAFVAYIDLWNIKLSPKKLDLFESLKTQYDDYVAARLIISGKYGSDTNLASICASLENMHASDMADRKLTPHDTLILFKLKNQDSFPEEILAYWCRSVEHYQQKVKAGSQYYTDQFKLAKMLDAFKYESDIDKTLKNLLKNQAKNWCDKGENQESIFKLLHFDIKRLDLFELPIKSWLTFLEESSQRYPDLMHYSIGSLKKVYTEQELATFITKGLQNPETELVATNLKHDLFQHWFNDLKKPSEIAKYFGKENPLLSDYSAFHENIGYSSAVRPIHTMFWPSSQFSDSKLMVRLPEKPKVHIPTAYGLLKSFASFVAEFNTRFRVESLDLFALLCARFDWSDVTGILTSGNMKLRLEKKFDRTITRAQNSQIQFWIKKNTDPDVVIKKINLIVSENFTFWRLKLFLMYMNKYNDISKPKVVTPFSVLEKAYHPVTIARLFYKLPKIPELKEFGKQIEKGVFDFFKHTDLPPDKMLKDFPFAFKRRKSKFDQTARLWLINGKTYQSSHPDTPFHPIRILNTVHTDIALIHMITKAAKDNNLKSVAEVLKRDLWSKWVNEWQLELPELGTSDNVINMKKDYWNWLRTIKRNMKEKYHPGNRYWDYDRDFNNGMILDKALLDDKFFKNIFTTIEQLNENHLGEPLDVFSMLRLLFDESSVFRLAYPPKVEDRTPHVEAVIKQLQADQELWWHQSRVRPANLLNDLDFKLDTKNSATLARFKTFVKYSVEYYTNKNVPNDTLMILSKHYGNDALNAILREATKECTPSWIWKDASGTKKDIFQIVSDPNKASLHYAWMKYMFVMIMDSPRHVFEFNDDTIKNIKMKLSDDTFAWLKEMMDTDGVGYQATKTERALVKYDA